MPRPQSRPAALDALDRAFASEGPFPVTGCLYCYGEQDLAQLSGSLGHISDDLVSSVAAKTPDHWDDFPRLYRRLVPRIIRPVVTGGFRIDEELVASRLVQAGWTTWDAPLTEALRDVWDAWWQTSLRTHPGPVSSRTVLAVVTVATGGLSSWLDTWTGVRTAAADARLADLIDDVLFESEFTDLSMGFYGEYHATAELVDWLLTDVRDRVADARPDAPYRLETFRTGARHAG
ncbi:hypothetical protein OH779_37730 [Actinacidiphila glaucinigra]|uniref:hypothetical protein n=1 Tax=Actinacidiphila glaucinigra TaxID=235986 RepID=UPI00386EBA0A